MKYALIFGKNWRLSLAEILSYLEMEKIEWIFVDLTKKALVVDADFKPDKIIEELGGTLKITHITKEFDWKNFENQKFTEEEKNQYISIYGSKKLMHPIRKIFTLIPKDGVLEHSEIIKKNIPENCFVFGMKTCYFGRTIAVSDPFMYKERDEKRPVTEYLTISPSRARILINLAQASSNTFDPFCGIGTIAQEAILRGVKTVYCADISQSAVNSTKKNTDWTKKIYRKNSSVIIKKSDVREFKFDGIQSIATEPDLGPALKSKPGKSDALKIISYLKTNYNILFKNAYKAMQKNARIAVIFPCINSFQGKVFMDKHYTGFYIIDLFEKIPQEYKNEFKLRKNFILDEEREKGRIRNTIREFGVFKVLKK